MTTYRLAVIPGDGIGPEITAEGLKVLEAAGRRHGVAFDTQELEAGAELYRRTGAVLPEAVFDACQAADAMLLGSCGLPDVRRADGTEAGGLVQLTLRKRLELYAGVRPVRLLPGVRSRLRTEDLAGIDYLIVRENTEGLFASLSGGARVGGDIVADTGLFTRRGIQRVVRRAFDEALKRNGAPADGVKRVTCVDKSNVMPGFAHFRRIFDDVAAEYPDVEADAAYVDAFAYYLVVQPDRYDVVVAENLLGDIISDLGAGTVGGLGLAPSGDVGREHGLFQPAHGSAPDIAGKNTANPLAMILSVAMMLRWLGEGRADDALLAAADRVEQAVAAVLVDGAVVTPDLGGAAVTAEVGDAVVAALERV